MSTIVEIKEALAAAVQTLRTDIPDLQIYPKHIAGATPPTIDIYEADPFTNGVAFGGSYEMFFTVRARVTTADSDAGQDLLSHLMEPTAGVTAALLADQTLGGVVDTLGIAQDGASGLREYRESVAVNTVLLGSEWRVQVYV